MEEGRSTCSKRATPSVLPRRRCALPWTRWTEGLLTSRRRSRRSTPPPRRAAAPDLRPGRPLRGAARGVAASPGAAKGAIVFTAEDAVAAARGRERRDPRAAVHRGRRRRRVPGGQGHPHLRRGQGVACGAGGTRHGPPCRHRRGGLHIDPHAGEVRVNDTVLHAGDMIAIDGSRGHVTLDDVPLVRPRLDERSPRCSMVRRVRRSACARTPIRPRTRAGRAKSGRGHRAVPDGAHVHGGGPASEDAR